AEIVTEVEDQLSVLPDHWIVAGGTGGTAVGIAEGLAGRAHLHVITAVRKKLIAPTFGEAMSWAESAVADRITVDDRFHLGGLGKWDRELISRILEAEAAHTVPLDPVYTGKAWVAMEEMMDRGEIPGGSTVLFVHTGGRAGTMAFEYRFGALRGSRGMSNDK
ncbi:MAG: pyridoxal-phosphate dependent enzyme, partial [Saprospiraceae bacterium]|nr:pyridoxal-phosphate dependent enzyme [Saprospiraceae bacterium]